MKQVRQRKINTVPFFLYVGSNKMKQTNKSKGNKTKQKSQVYRFREQIDGCERRGKMRRDGQNG